MVRGWKNTYPDDFGTRCQRRPRVDQVEDARTQLVLQNEVTPSRIESIVERREGEVELQKRLEVAQTIMKDNDAMLQAEISKLKDELSTSHERVRYCENEILLLKSTVNEQRLQLAKQPDPDHISTHPQDLLSQSSPASPNALRDLLSSLNNNGLMMVTAPVDSFNRGDAPANRSRGRPKGSKNKKGKFLDNIAPSSGQELPKRKRGRPRKERPPAILDPNGLPFKRRRGRPRKYDKSEEINRTALWNSMDSYPDSNNNNMQSWPASTANKPPLPSHGCSVQEPSDVASARETSSTSTRSSTQQPVLTTDALSLGEGSGSTGYISNQHTLQPGATDGSQVRNEIVDQLEVKKDINQSELQIQTSMGSNPSTDAIPILTDAHLELIYHLTDGRLFCRLCAHRHVPGTPVISYCVGTSAIQLIDHCTVEHPRESKKFQLTNWNDLAEIKRRMLATY